MKKLVLAAVSSLALASVSAFASQSTTCYQLSSNGVAWSRTPETLCVTENPEAPMRNTITLNTGLPPQQQRTVATFELDRLQRSRCMDCNEDVFGVAIPSNSVLNALTIRFEGRRDQNGESGSVTIGAERFFYRSVR